MKLSLETILGQTLHKYEPMVYIYGVSVSSSYQSCDAVLLLHVFITKSRCANCSYYKQRRYNEADPLHMVLLQ